MDKAITFVDSKQVYPGIAGRYHALLPIVSL